MSTTPLTLINCFDKETREVGKALKKAIRRSFWSGFTCGAGVLFLLYTLFFATWGMP